ncbi:hypothetical protein ACB092_07G136000 [Castanea dentata]
MDEFLDNRPSFFKIIFEGHTTESMRIPPKFVKHLPIELPDQAILKGPSGEKWHVKLCKTVDGLYLKDGWEQFFRDHSLGDNEWLLFRYNGDLCFNVHIFGKNGCERVNASSTKANHETTSSSGKRPRGRPRKTPLGLVPLHESKPCKVILGQQCNSNGSKICKVADSFTSDFPHFKCCIKKSSVVEFLQTVPSIFARNHLPQSNRKIILRNSEDKSWEMNYINKEKNYKFSRGWKDFVRDNKLKVGDICIFELVAKNEMRVHIFPVD